MRGRLAQDSKTERSNVGWPVIGFSKTEPNVPWDANPRLREVVGRCGCIGMGPGLGRVLKTRLGVYGIVEPWKQKDRIQIGYGLSETQDKAKARHARAPSARQTQRI